MGNKQFLGWLDGTKGLASATGAAHLVGPVEAGGWEPRGCSGTIGLVHDGRWMTALGLQELLLCSAVS
jgi:hypothetical protein